MVADCTDVASWRELTRRLSESFTGTYDRDMPNTKPSGRIYFPGNPWPRGHEIVEFVWSARVERGTGIWFDFHLLTENYYAADDRGRERAVEDEYAYQEDLGPSGPDANWTSDILWYNHHYCRMSSTEIGQGFLAATKDEPLDMTALTRKTFEFDKLPLRLKPPKAFEYLRPPCPFNIYLLGHDEVSRHRVKFRQERGKRTYAINWTGRIASIYSGSFAFKHTFEAKLTNVRFAGIVFPQDTPLQQAQVLVAPFVNGVRTFMPFRRAKHVVVLPVAEP
jgi:hypothetical protein